MIDRDHPLPLTHQADALNVSLGSLYYKPSPVSAQDLELMRIIDRVHTDYPFAGARMLRDMLRLRGYNVGRRSPSSAPLRRPLREHQYRAG
jgi:putative transposase